MADLTLGNALVQIGGDLGPLAKAFEEAKAMRDAFNRDMAANSQGLLSVNKAANDTAASLGFETTATKAAGDAAADAAKKTDQLTQATTRSTEAARTGTKAAQDEAKAQQDLSAMIDRSIASMRSQSTLKTSGPLKAITAGGYGDDLSLISTSRQNAQMGGINAAGKIDPAIINGVKQEAEEVEKLGQKAGISSTSMRELIVLIREAGRGDFTRMAGSASLLAQNMGLIEKVGIGLILQLGAVAAATAVLAVAAGQASSEVNHLDNELLLSGNRAGLTAGTYKQMAEDIADASNTSVKSNQDLISILDKTGGFTEEQMRRLVLSAQTLSKATGESAEDIVKDFAKMADSPTKYAESYEKAFPGVITPIEVNHIRELEARGEKEQAIGQLIQDVMVGITNNTVDNIGIMEKTWNGFQKALSDGWSNLKNLFKDAPIEEQISSIQSRMAILDQEKASGGHDSLLGKIFGDAAENDRQYKALNAQLDVLLDKKNAADRAAAATAANTAADQRQAAAFSAVTDSYVKGIDAPKRYQDAVAKLNATLADSVKMSHDTPIGTVLSAAMKSSDSDVRDLASHYTEAVDKIKKANLPDEYKADAKAAREAESAAKKAAREAEELEKRRQDAIGNMNEEAALLRALLPLYLNQSMSLEEVGRARAIETALQKVKLDQTSAEGKALAQATAAQYDLNAAIEAETKARSEAEAARNALTKRDRGVQSDISVIGTTGDKGDAEAVADALAKVDEAQKKQMALVDAAEKGATFTHEQAEAQRTAITAKAVADRAAITAEGLKLQSDREALDMKKLQSEYKGAPSVTTAGDVHSQNQKLGGKFKESDDLAQLKANTAKELKVAEDAHKAGIDDEQTYQDKITKIKSDAAAEQLKIKLAQANMEIDAGQSISDSLTSITQDMFGKQSTEYKLAFDVAKAFTIAKATLAMYQDVANALGTPFPANIPMIAQAFAQGATIVSAVTSLKFAAGGFIPNGVGGPTQDNMQISASGGEFMVNSRATAAWRPTLEAINAGRVMVPGSMQPANDTGGGGRGVTIHNYGSQKVQTSTDGNGNLVLTIREQIAKEAPGVIARDMAKPNSSTSKAIRRTTTAAPRRK